MLGETAEAALASAMMFSSSPPPPPPAQYNYQHYQQQKRIEQQDPRHAPPPSCLAANRCVSNCVGYGRVCPVASRRAAETARKRIDHLRQDSQLLTADSQESFTVISRDQIALGRKLGEGGFCNVLECRVLNNTNNNDDEDDDDFLMPPPNKQLPTLALKRLKRKTLCSDNASAYPYGAADLVQEAYLLQALQPHPHIIRLDGILVATSSAANTTEESMLEAIASNHGSGSDGLGLLVEKLSKTLDDQIRSWHQELVQENRGSLVPQWLRSVNRAQRQCELQERLRLAHQIATALEYLHSRGICYRDLKPENIGFDEQGVLKLFDFGLAKECKRSKRHFKEEEQVPKGQDLTRQEAAEDFLYDFTGNTGSRRYMAPEVSKDEPYNQSVDVYSFAILLWEMLTTTKPFKGYTAQQHYNQVVEGGERPPMPSLNGFFDNNTTTSNTANGGPYHAYVQQIIRDCWPIQLQQLLHQCWATTSSSERRQRRRRPTFTQIKQRIKEILQELSQLQQPREEEERAASEGLKSKGPWPSKPLPACSMIRACSASSSSSSCSRNTATASPPGRSCPRRGRLSPLLFRLCNSGCKEDNKKRGGVWRKALPVYQSTEERGAGC